MKKRRINIRKHKRRLKSGNATIVKKHKRQLRTSAKRDPQRPLLPDAEWYKQNTGENFYDYLFHHHHDGPYNYDDFYLEPGETVLYLEQCFPLKNDPHLPEGMLCSIVAWPSFEEQDTRNKLVLKRCGTDKEGYISCVHTAITDISLEDLPKDLTELYGLSHNEALKLTPIEHFRALRSWAEGITEYGIENAILDSLADLDMPFGFNWELQRQFLNAIRAVYADVGVLLAVDVLNNIYNSLDGDFDWSNDRFDLLEHYILGCGADPEMFDKCCQLFPDNIDNIKFNVAWGINTPPEVLEKIYKEEKEGDWTLRDALAKNHNTPLHILKLLSFQDPSVLIRNVAKQTLRRKKKQIIKKRDDKYEKTKNKG